MYVHVVKVMLKREKSMKFVNDTNRVNIRRRGKADLKINEP